MAEYVHSKLMTLYSQTALTSDKPWEGWWELRLWDGDWGWRPCKKPIDFNWKCLYAPPQRFTNHLGLDIPRGYDNNLPPEDGMQVLIPSLSAQNGCERLYYHKDFPEEVNVRPLLTLGLVYPDTPSARDVLRALKFHLLGFPLNTVVRQNLDNAMKGNVLLTNETKDTMRHRLMKLESIYA